MTTTTDQATCIEPGCTYYATEGERCRAHARQRGIDAAVIMHAQNITGYAMRIDGRAFCTIILRDARNRRHAAIIRDYGHSAELIGLVREKNSRARRGFAWDTHDGGAVRNAIPLWGGNGENAILVA